MTPRRLLLVLSACALLVASGEAPAYPPVTCGRIHVKKQAYVVRSHGPACRKALSWSRRFIVRHRSPRGFRCRAYGDAVPSHCVRRGRKKNYFSATKP